MGVVRRSLATALSLLLFALLPSRAFEQVGSTTEKVTILYTNDFHAAIEPRVASWLPGQPMIGGSACLAGLIEHIRRTEPNVVLFDSGDQLTGPAISLLTKGEAVFDLMRAMHYDAMALGNHEFDYGIAQLQKLIYSVPFPVLGANIFYKGTDIPFTRPYAVIETGDVRIGVIGIIGSDAASVTLPSQVTSLEFRDPIPYVRKYVEELKPKTDMIVVLAHQGKTGPMATDAEAHPEMQRDFEADKALAAAVPGIDVLVGGHAHRGIETPFVSPVTGTIIVQTYGNGTTLGYLQVTLDKERKRIVAHEGRLIRVINKEIQPSPSVSRSLEQWKAKVKAMTSEVIGEAAEDFTRDYNRESPLGNLLTDILRQVTGAEIAFYNSGGIRGEIKRGPITVGDVISVCPFLNTITRMELTGSQIKEIIEQGLTLERGIIQVSGLKVVYDERREPGKRIVRVEHGGKPLEDEKFYSVATINFLAEGGDLYETFRRGRNVHDTGILVSQAFIDYVRRAKRVSTKVEGRLVAVASGVGLRLSSAASFPRTGSLFERGQ